MQNLQPEEVDNAIQDEKSRTVKIFMVKYKCVLLFTFLGFAIFEMIYILADKIISDRFFTNQFFHFLNSTYRQNYSPDESSALDNHQN